MQTLKNEMEKIIKKKNINNIPTTIKDILDNENIATSIKPNLIAYKILEGTIKLEDAEEYFKRLSEKEKTTTEYRRQLCAYDIKKYSRQEKGG